MLARTIARMRLVNTKAMLASPNASGLCHDKGDACGDNHRSYSWHHGGINVLPCDAKYGVFGTIPEGE